MKRLLTLIIAVIISAGAFTAEAQSTRYHGELNIAGCYGIGDLPLNRLQVQTIHGARVGECFSAYLGYCVGECYRRYVNHILACQTT